MKNLSQKAKQKSQLNSDLSPDLTVQLRLFAYSLFAKTFDSAKLDFTHCSHTGISRDSVHRIVHNYFNFHFFFVPMLFVTCEL